VQQVDLHLRRAGFVNQRVDLDVLRLAERVHVVEQRVELIDRSDAIGLAADLRTARAAHRRLQGIIGIDVRFHQEKFQLGRDDRLPALRLVQIEHPPQHIARRHGDGAAIAVEAIVNHLRRRFRGPRHDPYGLRIRLQHDVDVRRIHRALVLRIVPGDGLQEDRFRQTHALFFRKFLGGHQLAAGDTGHVRNDRLDFGNTVFSQELLNRARHTSP
jgi:hypothetical protein